MDRVSPGVQFRDVTSDINRSKIQIPLFRDLSLPLESVDGLPSFGDWIERGFAEFRVSHPGSQQAESDREFLSFIENAEVIYASLLERYPRNYLLHGDLHHENILQDESGGWRAIDPKDIIAAGCVGLVLGSCWSLNSKQEVDFKRIRVLREFL